MGLVLLISYPKMAFRKMAFMRGWYIIFCIGETRGGRKKNGVRKKEVVAVEGTENATGNNSEVRRFFEALSIILRPCKMMDTSFCCTKTSPIISFVPSMAQAFIRGDSPLLIHL